MIDWSYKTKGSDGKNNKMKETVVVDDVKVKKMKVTNTMSDVSVTAVRPHK